MAESPRTRPSDREPGAQPARRKYVKPQLTEYGSVAKLTQGTATKQSDGHGGGFRRSLR
jgi:hypothetical protein